MTKVRSASRQIDCGATRLPSVDRALSLFELLSKSQAGLTMSELSRKLTMPKSTVHYLIRTLATRGYIQQCPEGRRYSLGLRFLDITDSSRARSGLASLMAPFLRQAVQRLNLTAIASVLFGAQSLIIGKAGCLRDQGGDAWEGRCIDLHCSAQGKALIASLPEERLVELFHSRELTPFTARTIPNFPALRVHLAQVRAKGFAVNDQEHIRGTRAVAAPVTDRNGSVLASVTVRGTTSEIPVRRIEPLGFEMVQIADQISRAIRGG